MLKSKENGAIFRIKQRYKIIPPTCGGSKGSSLGFETLGFAFGTFVAGPILAVLGLMIEAVYKTKLSVVYSNVKFLTLFPGISRTTTPVKISI